MSRNTNNTSKNTGKKKSSRREDRVNRGNADIVNDKRLDQERYKLSHFAPEGLQKDIVHSLERNTFTIVDGPSGVGKTSTALWAALHSLQKREVDNLIFIKNPTEVGDDKIGYLSGGEDDKLLAHMATTKRIFEQFMDKNLLDYDLKRGRIQLTIPNFLLGATLDYSIVVIDEAQLMSPSTVKLLTERCGKGTRYVILGDASQQYAVKNRVDGFTDFVERVTVCDKNHNYRFVDISLASMVGYVKLSRHDNKRSSGSAFINKIYEENSYG